MGLAPSFAPLSVNSPSTLHCSLMISIRMSTKSCLQLPFSETLPLTGLNPILGKEIQTTLLQLSPATRPLSLRSNLPLVTLMPKLQQKDNFVRFVKPLRLRQTSSASSYSTLFQQIVSFLEWDDAALSYAFYNGLKDSVKDELAKDDRPATLSALMEKAIKIDNRQFERSREKQASLARSLPPTTATQQRFIPTHLVQRSVRSLATPSSSLARSPQTIIEKTSSIKEETSIKPTNLNPGRSLRSSGKLPDTERAFRLQNNLCLYCGQSGHSVKNCVTLQQKNQSLSGTDPPIQYYQQVPESHLLEDASPSPSPSDYPLISLDYTNSEPQNLGNQ